jgi:hypothetical protein
MGFGEERAPKAAARTGPVAAAPAVPQPPPGVKEKEGPKKASDPLDADAFNREFHPERTKAAQGGQDAKKE